MTTVSIIIFVLLGAYIVLNFKYDIQMLQQNSYRIDRYWKWLKPNITSMWRLFDVMLLFLLFSTLLSPLVSSVLVGVTAIVKSVMILKRKSKKPLVFTKRVWRIYSVACVLALALYGLFIWFSISGIDKDWWYTESCIAIPVGLGLMIAIFSWAFAILAVVLLAPVEKLINKRFRDDAVAKLRSMPELKVIGITGSFGKTSTKHYLHQILSEEFDVLMTPGSFNTPMGVIRTIREYLRPNHRIFICEMGAKQKGDVKEICDIVNPYYGIITAVGPMHLESFKTMENVQSTKFELADALPSDGLVIINNDFEYCASRKVSNTNTERYSVVPREDSDYHAENIAYSHNGSSFTIKGCDGYSIDLQTPLLGECNISNLIAAVIMAKKLGIPDDKIKYAVSRIEQVEHRLSVKRSPVGITIIDDAFNSNPQGSRMAVDVLSAFDCGKRIIVTPGMIELGADQYKYNRGLGEYIAGKVDLAIIVGEYNKAALADGLAAGSMPQDKIIFAETFNKAQETLASILKPGDVILYENDLPDTFK